jgi:hypothetical protein
MTFLRDLSALLAARAARVQPGDPAFASIDLAAHLFAAAVYLREHYGEARMDTERPVVAYDLDEALELAAQISLADPVEAYLQVCGALIGVDEHLASDRNVTAALLPKATPLQPLNDQDQERDALFGTMLHWIKPKTAWRAAREHRESEVPRVNVYPMMPAEHLDTLGLIWDRGEAPEARPVRRRDLPVTASSSGFRIALCPLSCGGHPRFIVNPAGDQFTVDPSNAYANPAMLSQHLIDLGKHLESARVQLLVLPELSVTETARGQLEAMLASSHSLAGIVAGSFHVWRDGHAAPFNEAVFHVPRDVAWAHHKAGFFRVTDRDVAELSEFFARPLPLLQPHVVEGIRRGSVLQFWDTRVGRIAMMICADAIAYENMIDAVKRCRPDILLLPSMSPKTEPFEQLGESLARYGISVFYVNAGSLCERAQAPVPVAAFVHLGLPVPGSAPPGRIRWTLRAAPEVFRAKSGWRPALPGDVQVLGNQDGIVIDLAAHLSWRAGESP